MLWVLSVMASLSRFAGHRADQVGAHFRPLLAAVFNQEREKPAHAIIVGAVMDHPALALGLREPSPRQEATRQMPKHGALVRNRRSAHYLQLVPADAQNRLRLRLHHDSQWQYRKRKYAFHLKHR